MAWNEDMQCEIDRLLATEDISVVIAKAINGIIDGRIVQYMVSVDGPVNCSVDPAQMVDFGERLLCQAIDELKAKREV